MAVRFPAPHWQPATAAAPLATLECASFEAPSRYAPPAAPHPTHWWWQRHVLGESTSPSPPRSSRRFPPPRRRTRRASRPHAATSRPR
eukprot:2373596-Prymnesium_polylepis.1